MLHFECLNIIGWWVGLFLALWAALYVYGKLVVHETITRLLGRVAGGSALLVGLLIFLNAFMHELGASDCAHAWQHVVASLSATALIAGPAMLVAQAAQRQALSRSRHNPP